MVIRTYVEPIVEDLNVLNEKDRNNYSAKQNHLRVIEDGNRNQDLSN